MATLAVTNDFSAGTTAVAADVNQNFSDIETFVNSAPGVVQKDLANAKGDMIAATAADALTRVAVGVDGTVLTASTATATGVAWAAAGLPLTGGTLTGALTGTDATFTGTTTTYMAFSNHTASYVLVLADAGKTVEMNVGSANTLTIPPNSSVAFPVGTQIIVIQQGAGVTTITDGSGVTTNSKDNNAAIDGQYASVALIKRATDEWYVIGALA